MTMTYFWLIGSVILIIIEIITLGLTTIWFAAGALVAAAAAAIGFPFFAQLVLFAVVSIILLIFTRPIALKYFNRGRVRTNTESLVGKQAVVVEEINNLKATGQVVVNGQQWTARSVNDMLNIEKGAVVVICGIQGVKLMVNCLPQYSARPEEQVKNN